MFTQTKNADNSTDQISASNKNSNGEDEVNSTYEEASLVPLEADPSNLSMANHDGSSSFLRQFDSTTKPGYDVLISRVEALPGSFRRKHSFEICAKFSNQNSEGLLQDQVFSSELTVCLILTQGRLGQNRITCRVIDSGEVIKDYLQDANQLASEAEFIIKVFRCDRELQFENFSLIKICHPEVACTMQRTSNYQNEHSSQYLFKSINSLKVADRAFFDLISSSSTDMQIEVQIHHMESVQKRASDLIDVSPFDRQFNAVFGNELLLDNIMKYVILSKREVNYIRGTEERSVLAVNKTWRKSACRVTASWRSYAYRIKNIEKLIYLTPGGFPLGNVKPYRLIVEGNESASPAVLRFLRRYPPVDLAFSYHQKPHRTRGVLFNEALFASLKNSMSLAIQINAEQSISVEDLQSIMDRFQNSKDLFCITDFPAEPPREPVQSDFKLPGLLERLNLKTDIYTFQQLLQNEFRLSKLKFLRVNIPGSVLNGNISLDHQIEFSSKINRLIKLMPLLAELQIVIPHLLEATVEIPECLKLKGIVFDVCGLVCPSRMEHLERLTLRNVKTSLIPDIFTEGCHFPKLNYLSLDCIDLMNAAFVDRIADGVPNCALLRTTLKIDSESEALFTRLFLRFKKLTTLELQLRVEAEDYCSPSHIVSYFSGLTLNDVRKIQALPDARLSYSNVGLGGITSLKDLCHLTMKTSLLPPRYHLNQLIPLTELLFRLTFFRMSHLQEMLVDGGYNIADGVIAHWNGLGRKFEGLYLLHDIGQSSDSDDSDDDGGIHDTDESDDDYDIQEIGEEDDIHDNDEGGTDSDMDDNYESNDHDDIHVGDENGNDRGLDENDDSNDDGDTHDNEESVNNNNRNEET